MSSVTRTAHYSPGAAAGNRDFEWMLPGVAPTGRPVCVAFVVIVGMENGKISYEHIYWDQATVLVQLVRCIVMSHPRRVTRWPGRAAMVG
jgi:hypothetical protein